MFLFRRSPLSTASPASTLRTSRRRLLRAPIAAMVATALVGTTMLSGCGCDEETTKEQLSSSAGSSTVVTPSDAPAPGNSTSLPSPFTGDNTQDVPLSDAPQGLIGTPSDVQPGPGVPTQPLPAGPSPILPGSVLPQTNLDSKYAPLGVPTMAAPGPVKPLVIVVSLTRDQTVQLHEQHVGEKMAKIGESIPVVGEPVATMGGALAGSSDFSADHPNACVRTWVELSPTGWGTYATYVTGTECPAQMRVTGQLPGPAQ